MATVLLRAQEGRVFKPTELKLAEVANGEEKEAKAKWK